MPDSASKRRPMMSTTIIAWWHVCRTGTSGRHTKVMHTYAPQDAGHQADDDDDDDGDGDDDGDKDDDDSDF